MNESRDVRQINCTRCGAPLELLGGHRVRSVTCGYCGSVLDMEREYQVVFQYQTRERPYTPLQLGMQGRLQGVMFTVIGLVNYVSSDGYGWVDFQLYSPTHGYAWLTYEDGHYLFSRRVRDLPQPSLPGQLRLRSPVYLRGHKLLTFETYSAEVRYVEGELTWIAKRGDTLAATEAVDPPYFCAYEKEQNADELEYLWGEYLPAEDVRKVFGLAPPRDPPGGVHPAQPFRPTPWLAGLAGAGQVTAAVALGALLYIGIMGGGKPLLAESFSSLTEARASRPFTLQAPGGLLKLELEAPIYNNWAGYDVVINRRADDSEVFSLAKEIAYYEGVEDGERWSEGAHSASALFKLPEAGEYYLEIAAESEDPSAALPPLSVKLYEGVIVSRYFLGLLLLSLLAAAWLPYRHYRFERARWGEDDDD